MINSQDSYFSVTEQCTLLSINRSSYYYQPKGLSTEDLEIMNVIDETYTAPDFRSFSLRGGVEAFVYKGFSFLGTTLFCYFTILNISLHVRGV